MNPLQELSAAGQSPWLDFVRRTLITSGELQRLIEDGITGVTSNPSIFGKAIGGSTDYDEEITRIATDGHEHDALHVFEDLAIVDIQMAADVLRPLYDSMGGTDGFVSFEVEPRLARDTAGTIGAARRVWERIDRPNVMIKVPGTPEGLPAIEQLIADGINLNVTLLFSVDAYTGVVAAYHRGLERRADDALPVAGIASVASFFVSRVDSAIDAKLPEDSELRGKAAIANVKLAYEKFRELFSGERWERLAKAGAAVQRPLWASTSAKNPAYRDTLYVEELVGRDTVNTMPMNTVDAVRDHGDVREDAVTEGVEDAHAHVNALAAQGIRLSDVTDQLLEEGIVSFAKDFDALLETIDQKMERVRAGRERQRTVLSSMLGPVTERLQAMDRDRIVERIWRKDHTVWKDDPTEITNRLGWLTVSDLMHERIGELESFAKQAAADGYETAVLLGMGGSSLAPEVFVTTFGAAEGALELIVLDTTHPVTVERVTRLAGAPAHAVRRGQQVGDHDRDPQPLRPLLGAHAERRPVRRHHRSGNAARGARARARVPGDLPEPGRHRRPVLGAVVLRAGAGRADRRPAARHPGPGGGDADRVRTRGPGRAEPRGDARRRDGRGGPDGSRQADAAAAARDRELRQLGRAADRRVHGQGGQRRRPRRRRAPRIDGRVRRGPVLRRDRRARRRAAREPRPPRRAPRVRRAGADRRRVLPLGDGDGRRRLRPADQPVRPAERAGGQGRHEARSSRAASSRTRAPTTSAPC